MQIHTLGNAETLLQEGELKKFEINEDTSIVLAKRGGKYYALGATCTHYGGPLEKGVLYKHTLICPWHHACFDIRTGIREEPPALSSLDTYPVSIVDGQVQVELEAMAKPTAKPKDEDKTVIIVGGGAAGEATAEELRQAGFAGEIILLSASEMVPIDRPNLSKEYLAGEAKPDWIPLHDKSWYEENQIDLRLMIRVTGIRAAAHTVTTNLNEVLQYDKLLLATGSQPRTLNKVKGGDMNNIFTLRDKSDADRIIKQIDGETQVVIVGASFIGMEVAASLGHRGVAVSVVEMESIPFERVLGAEIGKYLQSIHEDRGVAFYMDAEVKEFHGSNGQVTEVELNDNTKIRADFVVLGIGVEPVTDYLFKTGITTHSDDGSIIVDKHLLTSKPDIYAAGDIARYPVGEEDTTRIEHWRVAQQHGFIVAHNMLDISDKVDDHVPFFWTAQWDTQLRYLGFAADWDRIIYRGNVADGKFIAFYIKDDSLRAIAGVGYDTEMDALEFVMKHDLPLSKEEMRNPAFDIVALVNQTQ